MRYILFTSTVNATGHEEEWECIGIPQNDCTDEIYSNTENMLADVICCFRLG